MRKWKFSDHKMQSVRYHKMQSVRLCILHSDLHTAMDPLWSRLQKIWWIDATASCCKCSMQSLGCFSAKQNRILLTFYGNIRQLLKEFCHRQLSHLSFDQLLQVQFSILTTRLLNLCLKSFISQKLHCIFCWNLCSLN